MAVLAIAAVGGILADGVGLSFGLGFAVFGSIAQLLLAPKPKTPTFRSMTSAWGATWPVVYNSFRIAGNVIQAGDVTDEGNKKKGGPDKFTQTFAIGFCEGPRTIVRLWADNQVIYDVRSNANPPNWQANTTYSSGDVVLPTGRTDWQLTASVNGVSGASEPGWDLETNAVTIDNTEAWIATKFKARKRVGTQYDFTVRLYAGDETQLADSALEEIVGSGNQPAYRGLCYAVFENFDLSKYGNRIPSIEAELSPGSQNITQVFLPVRTVPGPAYFPAPESVPDTDQCLADWTRGYLYQFADFDGGRNRPGSFIMKNLASDGTVVSFAAPPTNMPISGNTDYYSVASCIDSAGNVYLESYNETSPNSNGMISRINPNTLTEVAAMTPYAVSSGFDSYNAFQLMTSFVLNGTDYAFFACFPGSNFSGGAPVEVINLNTMTSVCHAGYAPYNAPQPPSGGGWGGICAGEKTSATVINLYMAVDLGNDSGAIPPQHNGYEVLKFTFDSVAHTLTFSDLAHYDDTDFDATWTTNGNNHNHFNGIIFDPSDNGLIFRANKVGGGAASGINGYVLKLSSTSKHIIWQVPIASGNPGNDYNGMFWQSDISTGTLILPAGVDGSGNALYVKIATATGTYSITIDASAKLYANGNVSAGFIWNSVVERLIYWPDSFFVPAIPAIPWTTGWAEWAPKVTAALTLADICADMSGRVGLTSSDYDFTGLASVIPKGCAHLQRDTARSFLESMMPAFFYDLTDNGSEIVGTLRSESAILETITEDELAASKDPTTVVDKISSTRGNDREIPQDLSMTFYDYQHDYVQGSQQARRNEVTQFSSGRNTVSVPVVLTPGDAATAAARGLYLLWIEREAKKLTLPVEFANLTPADVVEAIRGARSHIMRINRLSLDPSTLIISAEGVSEDFGIYSAEAAPAVIGLPSTAGIEAIGQPDLAVIDTAPLQSSDVGTIGVYVAGAVVSADDNWGTETVLESPDNSNFSSVATLTTQSVMGSTAGPLGGWARWTAWDNTNTIKVVPDNGQALASASKDDLINNFTNAMWLASGEIIQFTTATVQSDGSYVLSGLLRGRFGTEKFIGGATGQFVLLSAATMGNVIYSASDIGATRYWEGINGEPPSGGVSGPFALTMTTRRQVCLAPYFIRGSRDGSRNLTITGLRRMRYRGTPLWRPPETDAPVTVEIDIMNGASVVRTLTSSLSANGSGITNASGFAAYYAAADQVTDFGSTQASVTVKAYSKNVFTGRGDAGQNTV